jgi:CheY-like chemotaxis protein
MQTPAMPAPVVLLVDDETRILSALGRSLRRQGYRVLSAEDAETALDLLEETEVDAIISDQKMPGMSGLDLLRQVQKRGLAAARILLTGWPEEIPPARKAALGIHALLPKPWDDATLKHTLEEALARARST